MSDAANPKDQSEWSDNSTDSEIPSPAAPLYSHACQIEMFEQSMKKNTIVMMATGSGKTQIAKLRIEAELQKDCSRRVWFNVPNVDLALQQYTFLSAQLPSYRIRLITGQDNARFWTSQEIWDTVLQDVSVVVSTPQILLDALSNAVVSLKEISLLVFDEAHHCMSNAPMAKIMRDFYHPIKQSHLSNMLPAILGLTATSVTGQKTTDMAKLEANLDAICKTPTRQLDDYLCHVHLPKMKRVAFEPRPQCPPPSLQRLVHVVNGLTIEEDQAYLRMQCSSSLADREKVARILRKGVTPTMREMNSFLGHAKDLLENLGSWAANLFIGTCIQGLRKELDRREVLLEILCRDEVLYLHDKLIRVYKASHEYVEHLSAENISAKTQKLVKYLSRHYQPGVAIVIFVKRSSTAVILTQLLKSIPALTRYRIFSFVGSSSIQSRRGIADLADAKIQKRCFADFRKGLQDICVATPAMEEGIDVPAVNHVIRFDEPETFRSYVQSRGRARQPDSVFVMMHALGNESAKEEMWRGLEKEMVAQYTDEKRMIDTRRQIQESHRSTGAVYTVESTGARLTFANAPQHLQHFCQSLPHPGSTHPLVPVMMIQEISEQFFIARTILPSSLASELQDTPSSRPWKSEKLAKQDSAFQAYKKLHEAGLINDNLLSHVRPRRERALVEKRDTMYEVSPAISPWKSDSGVQIQSEVWKSFRLQVSCGETHHKPMLLFVRSKIDHVLSFPLFETATRVLSVTITPIEEVSTQIISMAGEITKVLFTLLTRKSPEQLSINDQLPFMLVPDMSLDEIRDWFEINRSRTLPLMEFWQDATCSQQPITLFVEGHVRPFLCTLTISCEDKPGLTSSRQLRGTRITKRVNYHDRQIAQNDDQQEFVFPISDCSVQGMTAIYGTTIHYMPSVLFHLELTMRAQLAREGPLQTLDFLTINMLTPALSAASATYLNYERLEYLGDSLLSYFTSVQMFFTHPRANEGTLSLERDHVINNARLQRATRELGLDAFLTTDPMPGKWTFPKLMVDQRCTPEERRHISSKTLGDVIESLVGATYLHGHSQDSSEKRVVSALKLFLPEINWVAPSEWLACYRPANHDIRFDTTRWAAIEDQVLGYSFRNKYLLIEALTATNSGLPTGRCSYERLEFLGDAVIGRIVKEKLYASDLELRPGEMTHKSAALLCHKFLSYLTLSATSKERQELLSTTSEGITSTRYETTSIPLVNLISGMDESVAAQVEVAKTTLHESYDAIHAALTAGANFPWSELATIGAPKTCSDIFESIIGAIFIDSRGSLAICEHVMGRLGMMTTLDRLAATRDIEMRHPVVRLHEDFPDVVIRCEACRNEANTLAGYDASVILNETQIGIVHRARTKGQARTTAAEAASSILQQQKALDA